MVRVMGQVRGRIETQQALEQAVGILQEELDQAMRASLFDVTRHSQRHYLSGPRPQRLGVITNRLRGSLSEAHPEFAFDVQRQQGRLSGTIGTNVVYAATHEPPDGRAETIIRPRSGRYLAIPTNFIKTPAGAVQGRYAGRTLRDLPNTFIVRSRTGGLSLWEAIPGRRRRRGEGLSVVARPIFWLVRQVRIPARPFLATALRDRAEAITQRFGAGLRRVEQRLTALLRSR